MTSLSMSAVEPKLDKFFKILMGKIIEVGEKVDREMLEEICDSPDVDLDHEDIDNLEECLYAVLTNRNHWNPEMGLAEKHSN